MKRYTFTVEADCPAEAAHLFIKRAVKLYEEDDSSRSFYDSCLSSHKYHKKLKRLQIVDGIKPMLLSLRLYSGSAGDVDLYKLIADYLLDLDKRKEINRVLA